MTNDDAIRGFRLQLFHLAAEATVTEACETVPRLETRGVPLEVVFAIVGHWRKPSTAALPLFSKIALLTASKGSRSRASFRPSRWSRRPHKRRCVAQTSDVSGGARSAALPASPRPKRCGRRCGEFEPSQKRSQQAGCGLSAQPPCKRQVSGSNPDSGL